VHVCSAFLKILDKLKSSEAFLVVLNPFERVGGDYGLLLGCACWLHDRVSLSLLNVTESSGPEGHALIVWRRRNISRRKIAFSCLR
jgi:hypothetical protein